MNDMNELVVLAEIDFLLLLNKWYNVVITVKNNKILA